MVRQDSLLEAQRNLVQKQQKQIESLQAQKSKKPKESEATLEKPTELKLKQIELNEIVLSLINEEDEHAETQKQLIVRSQIFNRQEEKLMDEICRNIYVLQTNGSIR